MMIPSIWTGMYAEMPLPQALDTLHVQGWTAFEMSTEHFVQIANAQDPTQCIEETLVCLERLDITMPQGHAYLQARVADFDAEQREKDIAILQTHLEIAARLNVKVVVIHPGGHQGYTSRSDHQRIKALNVQAFRRLGDYAGAHDLVIGLENLKRRGAETPDDLWDLLDAIDHPALGITLDTSHANLAALDIPTAIVEFSPRLYATHISDNDCSGDQHLTPGNGTIEWVGIMAALSEANYTGLFNLEIPGERHPMLQLRALKSRFALQVSTWLLRLI